MKQKSKKKEKILRPAMFVGSTFLNLKHYICTYVLFEHTSILLLKEF